MAWEEEGPAPSSPRLRILQEKSSDFNLHQNFGSLGLGLHLRWMWGRWAELLCLWLLRRRRGEASSTTTTTRAWEAPIASGRGRGG